MRIGRVIGTVTLNRWHPSLEGGKYKIAVPIGLGDLTDPEKAKDEELVVYDELNPGFGSLIAISEGREAAQPFHPDIKPIDAYNAAILDRVDIDGGMVKKLLSETGHAER